MSPYNKPHHHHLSHLTPFHHSLPLSHTKHNHTRNEKRGKERLIYTSHVPMSLHQDAGNNHSGLQLVLGLALSTDSPEELTAANTPSVPSNNRADDHHLTLSFITSNGRDADQPSLTLGLCGGDEALELSSAQTTTNSPHSAVSWSGGVAVKRERDLSSSDDQELEEAADQIERQVISSSRASRRGGGGYEDEDGPTGASRKKLRLTKDQSALLEESFKQHNTLNPKQKQALARQLNLRPRQVEVWFQNRRARTKLKQTEVDCELLKKCCETLTDENRRLQKELQELKAMKLPHPLYMPMPAATLSICPACESLGRGGGGSGASNKIGPFSRVGTQASHFYNPFTNPSAAC